MSTTGKSNTLPLAKSRKTTTVIVITVVVLVLLFCFVALPPIKYSQASKALANHEFDKAISLFTSLGGYQNSSELLNEAQYQKANELINHREYLEAISILQKIESYQDSTALLAKAESLQEKETKYEQAYKLLVQGKY